MMRVLVSLAVFVCMAYANEYIEEEVYVSQPQVQRVHHQQQQPLRTTTIQLQPDKKNKNFQIQNVQVQEVTQGRPYAVQEIVRPVHVQNVPVQFQTIQVQEAKPSKKDKKKGQQVQTIQVQQVQQPQYQQVVVEEPQQTWFQKQTENVQSFVQPVIQPVVQRVTEFVAPGKSKKNKNAGQIIQIQELPRPRPVQQVEVVEKVRPVVVEKVRPVVVEEVRPVRVQEVRPVRVQEVRPVRPVRVEVEEPCEEDIIVERPHVHRPPPQPLPYPYPQPTPIKHKG